MWIFLALIITLPLVIVIAYYTHKLTDRSLLDIHRSVGIQKNKVVLREYDIGWESEFIKERANIEKLLKEYALDVQHVGSTAIFGLCAKPIVDIAVAVKDEATLRAALSIMRSRGYEVTDSIERKG